MNAYRDDTEAIRSENGALKQRITDLEKAAAKLTGNPKTRAQILVLAMLCNPEVQIKKITSCDYRAFLANAELRCYPDELFGYVVKLIVGQETIFAHGYFFSRRVYRSMELLYFNRLARESGIMELHHEGVF